MSAKSSGDAELAEFVADHVLRDQHFIENLAVVDQEGMADELGNNSTSAGPSLDGVPNVGIFLAQDFFQELLFEIRSFF